MTTAAPPRRGIVLGAGGVLGAAWTIGGASSALEEVEGFDAARRATSSSAPRPGRCWPRCSAPGSASGPARPPARPCRCRRAAGRLHVRLRPRRPAARCPARPRPRHRLAALLRAAAVRHPRRCRRWRCSPRCCRPARGTLLRSVRHLVDAVDAERASGRRTPASGSSRWTTTPAAGWRSARPGAPPATLAEAVLASCSIPGWYAPVIDRRPPLRRRRHLLDHLASTCWPRPGLDEVYVLAPMASFDYDQPRRGRGPGRAARSAGTVTRRMLGEAAKVRARRRGGHHARPRAARTSRRSATNLMDPRAPARGARDLAAHQRRGAARARDPTSSSWRAVMRVYLPRHADLGCAAALDAGQLDAPVRLRGHAGAARAGTSRADDEELEYAALLDAARASLRLLGAGVEPAAPGRPRGRRARRAGAAREPGPGPRRGAAGRSPVALSPVVSAHVDDAAAADDVRRRSQPLWPPPTPATTTPRSWSRPWTTTSSLWYGTPAELPRRLGSALGAGGRASRVPARRLPGAASDGDGPAGCDGGRWHDAGMDAVTQRARPGQRAGPAVRTRQRRARRARGTRSSRAGQATPVELTMTDRRRAADRRRRADRRRPAARPPARARARCAARPHDDARAAIDAATRRRARLAGAVASTTGPRSCSRPPTCWPARGAQTAQRRHHARPVEDRVPGRDRRGLRADRLLALQRRTSPGRSSPSSRSSSARASGTAPTTGRSRASSTRSRRSTSPRSPATCRPRRR